jgi:HSP20 family protein
MPPDRRPVPIRDAGSARYKRECLAIRLPLKKTSDALKRDLTGKAVSFPRLQSHTFMEEAVMAVARYEPWNVVSQLQNEINRVFGNLSDTDSNSATSEWSPAVDVREYVDHFQLLMDLPGVEPKDVEITLDNTVLSVSGNRTKERIAGGTATEQPQLERIERHLGRFHRRFILPDTVDSDKVNASGRNGVLEIVIPKQTKAQPRRIAVR